MSDTYLGHVFDDEIFNYTWQTEPDPILLAMIQSGAVVRDSVIEGMISQRGNIYTIPFYNTLDASASDVNYDGQTDIPSSETTSDSQTGVVYGRAKAWTARDFIAELSGDDPMGHIARSNARWWMKKHQMRLIGILGAVFGITGDAEWEAHKFDIATDVASVTDENKIGITTINDAITQACGDNKGIFSLAIMHSAVANRLENLQLANFWVNNDANGAQRPMRIGSINGLTVVIDDGVPVAASGSATGANEYTTYLLGEGFVRLADGRVDTPSEVDRDPAKNGGQDTLYTRVRRTYHPNGFTYDKPSSNWTESPTDAQLFASARWARKFPAKSIAAARLITNG